MIIKKKLKDPNDIFKWHITFAWLLVRTSSEEIQVLRKVGRRKRETTYEYCDKDELLKAKLKGDAWADETAEETLDREKMIAKIEREERRNKNTKIKKHILTAKQL